MPCFGRLCSPMPVRQLLMLQPPSGESCSSSHLATCGGSELESCRPVTQLWPHVTGRGSQVLSMPPSRTLWAISGFSKVRAGLGSDGSEVVFFTAGYSGHNKSLGEETLRIHSTNHDSCCLFLSLFKLFSRCEGEKREERVAFTSDTAISMPLELF